MFVVLTKKPLQRLSYCGASDGWISCWVFEMCMKTNRNNNNKKWFQRFWFSKKCSDLKCCNFSVSVYTSFNIKCEWEEETQRKRTLRKLEAWTFIKICCLKIIRMAQKMIFKSVYTILYSQASQFTVVLMQYQEYFVLICLSFWYLLSCSFSWNDIQLIALSIYCKFAR